MSDYAAGIEASLQTRQAIEFFERTIQDLFSILDDEEGGLPRGSLELGSAILGKLNDVQLQGAFRGFLLYSWFFGDFLKSFVLEPEAHGALLDQHIRTEARDRILNEISKRAHAVVYMVFDDDTSFPIADAVRPNVNRMNNKLIVTDLNRLRDSSTILDPETDGYEETPLLPLILAPADLVSLVDALYPRVYSFNSGPDPFMTPSAFSQENSPSESSPYPGTAYGTMYLHDNIPIHAKARSTHSVTGIDMAFPGERHQVRSRVATGTQRFDCLRRDLENLSDTGSSVQPLPHQDSWIPLDVQRHGRISLASVPSTESFDMARPFTSMERQKKPSRRRNITMDAALRLAEGFNTVHGPTASSIGFDRFSRRSTWLEQMFEDEVELNHSKSDSAAAHYWWTALKHIQGNYPVCCLSGNDSKILQPLIDESLDLCERLTAEITALERQIAHCQSIFVRVRECLVSLSRQINDFRDKMWYVSGVRDSPPFEHARTIMTALNNMWLPEAPRMSSDTSTRGQIHSRPSSSSLLHQAELQTTDLLKAHADQGGPKKLADDQIEWVKRWMDGCGIENFCTGEERFHRFCLEIRETVNKLAGDTLLDGRFLWSSELFARERSRLDIFSNRSTSAHTATRPPSVVSDEGPLRGQDFVTRATSVDPSASPGRKGSFHGLDRWRAGRDTLAFDTASASDSPGRTLSTVPSDSYTGFWSPAVTQAQSATSVYSNHSRPASVHTDLPGMKISDPSQNAKAMFLQHLRNNLVSLLLSDLCCPVWSTGCETDAWISDVLNQPIIRQRIRKRASIEKLLSRGSAPSHHLSRPSSPRLKSKRSMSAGPGSLRDRPQSLLSSTKAEHMPRLDPAVNPNRGPFSFASAFADIIQRFSAEADPRQKLQSLKDLRNLVTSSLDTLPEESSQLDNRSQSHSRRQSRRWSQPILQRRRNESLPRTVPPEQEAVEETEEYGESKSPRLDPADSKVIDRMKKIFMDIRPRTLFRDLQLVSTFTDPIVLAEPDNAKALLLTGLAALAFKEDVCRTMVGIADRVIMQDSIKRRLTGETTSDFSLSDAINFWIICAKEGNAVAQREIATLYLTHSSFLPKASAPMSLSRDTFNSQTEISLRNVPETSVDESAMKLAVHWMQLAAKNGDKLAQSRLQTGRQ
ncbi:hypothetical protein UCRPC4_g05007 [Phaeomoniella chlamydospora]|uniref:Uncharacterized protein n=1 Tax=Phaeomoniella chlamydospora TaxID=158046 RepID=A0A0G2GNK1_PHACM|nr:hypothetical protein UCRPC4_g05007 [Phaeomoniella chlamydospora]